MNIFITGKIGAGKSTVARMFAEFSGTFLIDVDKIAGEVRAQENIKKKLRTQFGDDVFENDSLVLKKLAKKAFENKHSVDKLNKIMHPEIEKIMLERLKTDSVNIIDIPIPNFENKNLSADYIIYVATTEKTIKKRVSNPDFLLRQRFITLPDHYDYLVNNEFALDVTKKKVKSIWKKIENRCLL